MRKVSLTTLARVIIIRIVVIIFESESMSLWDLIYSQSSASKPDDGGDMPWNDPTDGARSSYKPQSSEDAIVYDRKDFPDDFDYEMDNYTADVEQHSDKERTRKKRKGSVGLQTYAKRPYLFDHTRFCPPQYRRAPEVYFVAFISSSCHVF
jgi:hypothetical protein